jgi:hypothetical protein
MASLPSSGRVPAALQVRYGPIDLLGPFFLQADEAARRRGITLSFAPVETLIATNRANRDSWRVLPPLYDPDIGGFGAHNGFCIVGRNVDGEIVATQAGRLYEWDDTNFHTEATRLSLFYRDPDRSKQPGETCLVSAVATRKVTGRVVFSGGAWYHPRYRGRSLSYILARIGRAFAYTTWQPDYLCSIMAQNVFDAGYLSRFGYRNIDWEVRLVNSPVGKDVRCGFVWQTPEELVDDTEAFLRGFDADALAEEAVARSRRA